MFFLITPTCHEKMKRRVGTVVQRKVDIVVQRKVGTVKKYMTECLVVRIVEIQTLQRTGQNHLAEILLEQGDKYTGRSEYRAS